jgi:hypothetical protein
MSKTFEQELAEAIALIENAQENLEQDVEADQKAHVQLSDAASLLHEVLKSRLNEKGES